MKSESKKRPTISDVARLAGVSTATVSRALSNPDVVSQKTREDVFGAVAQTGYRANLAAQMLRQNRSNTILVILPDIENPYFSEILAGIEDAATEAKQTILIGNSRRDPARVRDLLGYLRNGRADGALLLNGDLPLPPAEIADLPLVSVSENIPDSGIPHVGTDNVKAAADVTRLLIDLGHERIVHLAGPDNNVLSHQRQQGYETAMTTAGQGDHCVTIQGGFTVDEGCTAAHSIMQMIPRPTAVVCANDEAAMGVISGLAKNGLSVPRDISVTGFDDISFAAIYSPSLSTINQSRKEMGRLAMQVLLQVMGGSDAPPITTVDHSLISRDSTEKLMTV